MSDFKNGESKLIYIYVDGDYIPIGCLTSNGWSESADLLETTTRDNAGGWKTLIPTNQSYTINFDGLITTNDRSGTILTYDELRKLKRNKTEIAWKINSELTGYSDFGRGYIVSLSNTAEIDQFISFSCEIVGYGEPITITDTEEALNYTLNVTI